MIMVNAKSPFYRRYGELCFMFVIILTNIVKHFIAGSFKISRGGAGLFYYYIDTEIEEAEAWRSYGG